MLDNEIILHNFVRNTAHSAHIEGVNECDGNK